MLMFVLIAFVFLVSTGAVSYVDTYVKNISFTNFAIVMGCLYLPMWACILGVIARA